MVRKIRTKRDDMDDQGYYTKPDAKSSRIEAKTEAKSDKYDYKISKVDAKTEKSYATAAKRNSLANLIKWVLIAVGVFYALTKFGGSGLLDKAKGLIGL
jgi:hypothetical protein